MKGNNSWALFFFSAVCLYSCSFSNETSMTSCTSIALSLQGQHTQSHAVHVQPNNLFTAFQKQSVIPKITHLMKKSEYWVRLCALDGIWNAVELSRPYSWNRGGHKHKFHTRPHFFSLSQPCHFKTQLCPEYILTHLVTNLTRRHFLERKQKRNRKIEKKKVSSIEIATPGPRCDVMRSAAKGRVFPLPYCSRHICTGALQSEPSCACSDWRIEKSSSHILSTGRQKKDRSSEKASFLA